MTNFISELPPLVVLAIITGVAVAGGLIPFSPLDPWLIAVGTLGRPALLAAAVVLATVGQMATKTVLFAGAGRTSRVLSPRKRAAFDRLRLRLEGRPRLQTLTIFASAFAGLPPLYVVTVACGALRLGMGRFVVTATFGRVLRFAALVCAPQLLFAQSPSPSPSPSASPETFVLLSGLVGGTAGFRQLQARLEQQHCRVVVIDPYALSIDSADVSFAALARRVDAELARRGVQSAHVVGHAHGAGVMLRLAAMSPARVSDMSFLDVGALADNRTRAFSSSLRLVPVIARIPGGRDFVRDRMVRGLRANAGTSAWLDPAAQKAYTEPFLDNLDQVIAMAGRLNRAQEPETVGAVIARVRAPALVILGDAPRETRPDSAQIAALAPLGARVEHLAGVGHFPHEEAPDVVARLLLSRRPAHVAQRAGTDQ